MVLGRYLARSIYIGPDMTIKIMKSNREVAHRSIYQDLLPEEMKSTEHQTAREIFDASVAIKCGP